MIDIKRAIMHAQKFPYTQKTLFKGFEVYIADIRMRDTHTIKTGITIQKERTLTIMRKPKSDECVIILHEYHSEIYIYAKNNSVYKIRVFSENAKGKKLAYRFVKSGFFEQHIDCRSIDFKQRKAH